MGHPCVPESAAADLRREHLPPLREHAGLFREPDRQRLLRRTGDLADRRPNARHEPGGAADVRAVRHWRLLAGSSPPRQRDRRVHLRLHLRVCTTEVHPHRPAAHDGGAMDSFRAGVPAHLRRARHPSRSAAGHRLLFAAGVVERPRRRVLVRVDRLLAVLAFRLRRAAGDPSAPARCRRGRRLLVGPGRVDPAALPDRASRSGVKARVSARDAAGHREFSRFAFAFPQLPADDVLGTVRSRTGRVSLSGGTRAATGDHCDRQPSRRSVGTCATTGRPFTCCWGSWPR